MHSPAESQDIKLAELSHVENADDVRMLAGKVDDALQFAIEHGEITWSEAEETKVKRKIDMVILPLLFFGAIFSYADAQAYGFASIFGLIQDLNLYSVIGIVDGQPVIDTQRYSFSAGIAYLGTLVSVYPLLLLAQRLPAGKFLGAVSVYSGMCSMLVIACKDFPGIMTLRFFYGFQTVASPLSIIVTSMWWKTNEQPLRIGVWVGGAGVGSLIGQGIDFGGIHLQGIYASSPWKWLYVIFGSMAMGFGLVIFALLPATPMKAWFLNERERTIAVERLIENHTGIQTKIIKWGHIAESFLDPQLYVFCIFIFTFTFANNASGTFAGLLVTSFGYSPEQSILISMPGSAVAILSMYGSGFLLAKFHHHRLLIAILFLVPTIIGNAILWKAPRDNVHALLSGLYMAQNFYGAFIAVSSLISSNIGGHTKKTTVNAIIGIFSACGGFAGPWAYKGNEASEGYPTGQASTMTLMALSCLSLGALWFYYKKCNQTKATFTEKHGELVKDPNLAFQDLTDKENPVFQYVY